MSTFAGANCREPDADPRDWFPEFTGNAVRRAQPIAAKLCADCPTVKECARLALTMSMDVTGIWAGIYIPSSIKAGRRSALHSLQLTAQTGAMPAPRKTSASERVHHSELHDPDLKYCRHGHVLTDDNLYRQGDFWLCRQCRKQRSDAYRERKKRAS